MLEVPGQLEVPRGQMQQFMVSTTRGSKCQPRHRQPRRRFSKALLALFFLLIGLDRTFAQAGPPPGELHGSTFTHDASSLSAAMNDASLGLPASVTGGAPYVGKLKLAPGTSGLPVPVVVFLHGSSGLSLKAISEWQAWLAGWGVASVAPDSFALPDRLTYTSPIDKATYEKIHSLRASEIAAAVVALRAAPWADTNRLVLAGSSEGGPAVARYDGDAFAGRILYSWSCEDNYFVTAHRTVTRPDRPVLNVMSSTDVYFSPSNPWLGNSKAKGHCADAFKESRLATIVLIPGAPHTLLNLPAARHATQAFLRDLLGL